MSNIANWVIVLLAVILSACKSTPQTSLPPPPLALINQTQFNEISVESQTDIFALNNDIITKLDSAIPKSQRNMRSARKLLYFLLENGDASLSYQSGATLTASETFNDLNANCLSLSILAYSLAEHLELSGQFQRVHIPEYWALNRGINLLTGHINLKVDNIKERQALTTTVYDSNNGLVIDFDPSSRQERFKTTPIDKNRITAMFYNNKGAAAMLNKQYDIAFSYYKAAIKVDNQYSGGWGNLAVLLRLQGDFDGAETAYKYAIAINPNNNTALGNLALLYNITEREEQAKTILEKLDRQRQANPYYHIMLGNEAYTINDYDRAIKHYKAALELDRNLHDGYFALARSYYQLNSYDLARRYLVKATKVAEFKHDIKRYNNKLMSLNNMAMHVANN